jgi:hypothetical protein
MMKRLKYRKKKDQAVTAIRLDLETTGFKYKKWGGEPRAKRGDTGSSKTTARSTPSTARLSRVLTVASILAGTSRRPR